MLLWACSQAPSQSQEMGVCAHAHTHTHVHTRSRPEALPGTAHPAARRPSPAGLRAGPRVSCPWKVLWAGWEPVAPVDFPSAVTRPDLSPGDGSRAGCWVGAVAEVRPSRGRGPHTSSAGGAVGGGMRGGAAVPGSPASGVELREFFLPGSPGGKGGSSPSSRRGPGQVGEAGPRVLFPQALSPDLLRGGEARHPGPAASRACGSDGFLFPQEACRRTF